MINNGIHDGSSIEIKAGNAVQDIFPDKLWKTALENEIPGVTLTCPSCSKQEIYNKLEDVPTSTKDCVCGNHTFVKYL